MKKFHPTRILTRTAHLSGIAVLALTVLNLVQPQLVDAHRFRDRYQILKGGVAQIFRCGGPVNNSVSMISIPGALGGFINGSKYIRCSQTADGQILEDSVGYVMNQFPTNQSGETVITQDGSPFINIRIRKKGFTIDPSKIIFQFCIKPNPTSPELITRTRTLKDFGQPFDDEGDLEYSEVGRNIFSGPGNFDCKKVSVIVTGAGQAEIGRLDLPVQINGLSLMQSKQLVLQPAGCSSTVCD